MIQTLGALGLIGLLQSSCFAGPSPREVRSKPAPTLVPSISVPEELQAEAPLPSVSSDTSLNWAVYRAAGMPGVDRSWTPSDYTKAFKVLSSLALRDRGELPRAASRRSGGVFARVASGENFLRVSLEATTAAKAELGAAYLRVVPRLLGIYAPGSDGIDFAEEQVLLVEMILEALLAALDSSRAHAAVASEWGPHYDQQKALVIGIVGGASSMLKERGAYPQQLRESLASGLAKRLPRLGSHLKEAERVQIQQQLAHLNIH